MKINYFVTFILFAAFTTIVQAQTLTTLLQETKGTTPLAYYELSKEAEGLYQQGNYAKAAEALEKLTTAYQYDGEKWYLLGRSQYALGQFKEAAQAFVKAEEIGVPPAARSNVAYAARAFAQAGNTNLALDWLEKSVFANRYESQGQLFQEKNLIIFAGIRDFKS